LRINKDNTLNQDKTLNPYKCLSGHTILNSSSWEEAKKELKEANEFPLILFISHRWESYNNADPIGQQYQAVQNLIKHIVLGIHSLRGMELGEHHKYIPDLGRHGVLQGAMIASRLFAGVAKLSLNGDSSKDALLDEKPEQLIGVWYDMACLPQGKRSKEESLEFQYALKSLPSFVQHSNVSVLALREPNDDYEHRAWCMMEFMLATEQSTYSPLVYRYDLDGEVLQVANDTDAGLTFARSLEYWHKVNKHDAFQCWKSIFLQANTLPDSIVVKDKIVTLSIRTKLAEFVAVQSALFLAEKKQYPTHEPLEILMRLQSKTDLLTTLPQDGILVYLMILVGGCSLENSLREEFVECLAQVIELRGRK